MNNLEFFLTSDGEVMYRPIGKPMMLISEESYEVVALLLTKIRTQYPIAFDRLSLTYSKSEKNRHYFEYLMVRRFIKCNCPNFDMHSIDIDQNGRFKFEEVLCPMRGECKDEHVICKPTLKTELSPAEQRVLRLIVQGKHCEEIGEMLHISPNTVHNHRTNIKTRLNFHTTSECVAWWITNGMK